MLLAEANQWPEDAAAYFGETATSATWRSTSRSCRGCSWRCGWRTASRSSTSSPRRRRSPTAASGRMFLRNHDELTLEMVTDEERDYMYRAYAQRPAGPHQPRHPPPPGAAARTTTAGGSSCMNALLFSLPGTPVIYYGDEIGMGDNIYLGDRNGVRTPMQWSGGPQRRLLARRTGSASTCRSSSTPSTTTRRSTSRPSDAQPAARCCAWMKRLIALRKRHPAFGRGVARVPRPREPQGPRLRPRAPGAAHPRRRQPVALRRSRRARPLRLQRDHAGRAVRPHRVPPDRRAALPAYAGSPRLLLVLAGAGAAR